MPDYSITLYLIEKYMKKFPIVISFLFLAAGTYSQELNQVTFSGGTKLSYLSLLTDRIVLIRISEDGKILEWGLEEQSFRNNNYYAPKLQPYLGRVEYYGPEADSVSRGKVKSVGSAYITYYGNYETESKIGKIKTIGVLIFDYYSQYDSKDFRGKIRYIGNLELSYYSSFDIGSYTGNLKSIGSTAITYYSSFDDKMIRGKLKSIGPFNYSWYTSLDMPGYGGGLKSGALRQNIGSITYILQ
jgi:hypothetical protein